MDVLWSKDIDQWCSYDITQKADVTSFDLTSNEDDKSSSYRSGSVVSRNTTKSQQRSRTNLSVTSQSDGSTYSRISQSEQVPSAQSEGRILDLLAGSGYPMTQVNGQRKLGPPPGWTKPPPDPECEIFVGKIPRDLHEDTLYPIFSEVGEIYEIRLMMDFSGTNRGYCFIMFTKAEYAERAIRELDNWEIRRGHKIGVVASINNCRLCIGQLPATIKSEIVITTFYDLTEEVSKVSVYKHMNGQVRYALVWYRTHRGAAMARRRLLPERATLFENAEVSIDWAHPGMTPNNVIEESGTRDENGVIQFSKNEIGLHSKRTGTQRRGRDDFLDKSIKNYLQDKNVKKNASIQRNKCPETSGRMEKPLRSVGLFAGRQKTQKSRMNYQKFSNDVKGDWNKENRFVNGDNSSGYLSHSSQENYSISGRENKKLWYPKSRDINGNIEMLKNRRAIEKGDLEKSKMGPQGGALSVANFSQIFTNFQALNQVSNYNENLLQNQKDPRVIGSLTKNRGNFDTPKGNNFYGNNNVHHDRNYCHQCRCEAQLFLNNLYFQGNMPVYRTGTHVFDNYFRGANGRGCDQQKDEQQHFLFPFNKMVPQNLYGTSSFAGYRVAPIYPDRSHSRSILGRLMGSSELNSN